MMQSAFIGLLSWDRELFLKLAAHGSRRDQVVSAQEPHVVPRSRTPDSRDLLQRGLALHFYPLFKSHFGKDGIGAEEGVTHCPREWRAFLNHSTQCSAGSVAWSLRPGLGADTENPFHAEPV